MTSRTSSTTLALMLGLAPALCFAACEAPAGTDAGVAFDAAVPRDASTLDGGSPSDAPTPSADAARDRADAMRRTDAGASVDASEADAGRVDAGCERIEVSPSSDETRELLAALTNASSRPIAALVGPSGEPQGRVYLGPGDHRFGPITVPSHVRIEIAPGATLRPRDGADGPGPSDWGLFLFGTLEVPTRNVSVVAGDGCDGPGVPDGTNKPRNTDFRGNDPLSGGMGNAAVPFNDHWDTDAMWVMDLDPSPAHGNCDVQVTGFFFRHAYDVLVEDLFTIQNASRVATGVGPVPGASSRTTAMMFDPYDGTSYVDVGDPSLREGAVMPHRITVRRHYNILSPSGQGANQVRACLDCTFEDIFSHGGAALRLETDGIRTTCGDCSCTGPAGEGFLAFGTVDGLTARRIEGAFGNFSVMFNPHCLPNGSVHVTDVRGTSQNVVVSMAAGDADRVVATFGDVSVTNVSGCGGSHAQDPMPARDSYLLIDSRAAFARTPALPWGRLAGALSWPSGGSPGGLADGAMYPAGSPTPTHPPTCSATF